MKIINLTLLVLLALQTPAYACPMCKDALKALSRLTEGYFWSIILMLSVPFLLVGVFTGVLTRAHRRNRR